MKKILIIFILLFSSITLFIISNQKENEVVLSNINNDIEGLAFYLQSEEGSEEYNSADTIPSKDDGYIFKEAVCNDESNVSFNNATWSLKVSNMQEGKVRCKLYFDIDDAYARKYILSQNTVNEGIPDFGEIATTNEGIFTAEDDYGTSYYYRGAVDNNYFYFAGYYWRIIRINGDGTVRLIYQGTSPTSNGVISESKFNENSNNNAYLGYMYKTGEIHGTENSSTIKTTLENWYNNSIEEAFKIYINNDQGFCNDRTNSTNTSGAPDNSGGTGTTETYYGARHRVFNLHQPSFKCNTNEDYFTVSNSQYGNKKLSSPIGLINVDEVAFAGGSFNKDNASYYLNSGVNYWVMSPSHFSSNAGYMYNITTTGNLYRSDAKTSTGVRPVINLNKNIKLEGTGTASDPYRITETELPSSIKTTLLTNYPTQLTREDFSQTITATTTGTIYKSLDESQYDNDGEVYYFAGNPTDNWISFAGYYWRVVRINGNGSVRIIYQGTSANATGEGTQIGTSAFNTNSNDNAYVGFKYTLNNAHGTGTSSTILNELNEWYTSSGLSDYADDIDVNTGFCNDRIPYSGSGIGTTRTFYETYNRLVNNKKPTFECSNNNDLFTTNGSSQGNGALQYPIGLITADEIMFAGGTTNINTEYYLYTGQHYWTISPYMYPAASMLYISSFGGISTDIGVSAEIGIRPVINLKADVTISSGNGTSTNPYIIE